MIILAATVTSYAFDKYTLDRDQLPQPAREMLEEYFPKAKIAMIKIDKHLLRKTDYDVKLVNGTKIEFSNAGKWTSVDCKDRAVPDKLIMKPIRNYVNKNYAGVKIVKVVKKSSGYIISLSDGIELKFNLLGQYKSGRIED